MKHLRYLSYVVRHKWFVFVEGLGLDVSLWQLVVHDWHKFTPTEWFPYVEKFYGDEPAKRRDDGGYDPTALGDTFTKAWHHHQSKGKHHWQYWVMPEDDGTFQVVEMPEKYVREMVADWHGAGRAQGNANDVHVFYAANKDRMQLHPLSRKLTEYLIGWSD